MHGSWDPYLGHNAPLHKRSSESWGDQKLNVEYAANYWVQRGCPKEKLIVGLGTYGRTFSYSGSPNMGSAAHGAGAAGPVIIKILFYLNQNLSK